MLPLPTRNGVHMRISKLTSLLYAVMGACLLACQQPSETPEGSPSTEPAAESVSAFDRSMLALKAAHPDMQERLAAIDDLAARYGRHIEAPATLPDPVLHEMETSEPGPQGLGKTAAVTRYYPVRGRSFSNTFTLWNAPWVEPGQTLTAWTARSPNSAADPFLVAFYREDGTLTEFNMRVVGLNDDHGGSLDSRFTWTNNTGVRRSIHVIAFAYTPSVSGEATMVTTVNNANPLVRTGPLGGTAIYDHNMTSPAPAAGCVGPLGDRLTLRAIANMTGHPLFAMLVNSQSMRGAMLYNTQGVISKTLDHTGPVTASGYPNFLLLSVTNVLQPPPADAVYSGIQYQKYSCPN